VEEKFFLTFWLNLLAFDMAKVKMAYFRQKVSQKFFGRFKWSRSRTMLDIHDELNSTGLKGRNSQIFLRRVET
jgi:hypothetical protein